MLCDLTATDSTLPAAAADDGVTRDALPPKGPAEALGSMWALYLGLAFLMIGNGLNGALIGVRSGEEGFSVVVTGVIMAGYFAGFLLAPSVVVKMISSVGHIRVFAGLAATASSTVIIHSVSVLPVTWTLLRLLFGFCAAGLYIVIESWLSEMSDAANRGRTLAFYMIVSMGGFGIGQFAIVLDGTNESLLFVVASVLVSMSLVPVTLAATTKAPEVPIPDEVTIRELFGWVPTGVISSFLSGAAAGIVIALSASYASSIGLSVSRTAFFLVAPTLGGILFQWPIGRISDKVSRRAVILTVAVIGSALSMTLMVVPEQSVVVPMLMVCLGGMLYPLYSLVVSFALDWTPDGKTVGAAATLIRINGSGALVGPLAAAPLMSGLGPRWFFWAGTITFGAIAVQVVWRIVVVEAMPVERQRRFLPLPGEFGATALGLISRTGARRAVGRQIRRRHKSPSVVEQGVDVVAPDL